MKKKSSPSTSSINLRSHTVRGGDSTNTELQIVEHNPSPISVSRSVLPPGWTVERKRRLHDNRFDTFYHEPGTGRKFRSLNEVQKYLKVKLEMNKRKRAKAKQRRKPRRKRVEKRVQIVAHNSNRASAFGLPDGWIVEEIPRVKQKNYAYADRYYYEPGTMRKFRSLVGAKKYINDAKSDKESVDQQMQIVAHDIKSGPSIELPDDWIVEPVPQANQKDADSRGKSSRKKNYHIEPQTGHQHPSPMEVETHLKEREGTTTSPEALQISYDISPSISQNKMNEVKDRPPAKVNWILTKREWNPYLDGSKVSSSTQQKWSEEFLQSIQN